MITFNTHKQDDAGCYFHDMYLYNCHQKSLTMYKRKVLENMILITKSITWCANSVWLAGMDVSNIVKVIAESRDPYYCYTTASYIYPRTKDSDKFAEEMELLEEGIIKSGDAEWCSFFIKSMKRENYERLGEVILASNDEEHIKWYKEWCNKKWCNYDTV